MSRIAYIISAYTDAPHLACLVRALDQEADFYVHIDSRVDDRPFRRLLEDRVRFVPRHHISWGGWEQVAYQKELLKAVAESGIAYGRVVCLSGQDYPLWSNDTIHRYFDAHADTEFIMGENLTRSPRPELQARFRHYHFFRDLPWQHVWLKNKLIVASRWLMKLIPLRKPPTVTIQGKEAEVYAGSDYWALSMPCAMYVYRMLCQEPALTHYFRHSFVPSEMCIQTIVFSSPYADRVVPYDGRKGLYALTPLHYIDYGKSIKVLTPDDLPVLRQCGKMFCRKVKGDESAPMVQLLERERAILGPSPTQAS